MPDALALQSIAPQRTPPEPASASQADDGEFGAEVTNAMNAQPAKAAKPHAQETKQPKEPKQTKTDEASDTQAQPSNDNSPVAAEVIPVAPVVLPINGELAVAEIDAGMAEIAAAPASEPPPDASQDAPAVQAPETQAQSITPNKIASDLAALLAGDKAPLQAPNTAASVPQEAQAEKVVPAAPKTIDPSAAPSLGSTEKAAAKSIEIAPAIAPATTSTAPAPEIPSAPSAPAPVSADTMNTPVPLAPAESAAKPVATASIKSAPVNAATSVNNKPNVESPLPPQVVPKTTEPTNVQSQPKPQPQVQTSEGTSQPQSASPASAPSTSSALPPPPTPGTPAVTAPSAPIFTPSQEPQQPLGFAAVRAQMNGPRMVISADAIALAVRRHQMAGIERFDIRIDPPELGRIEVRIELSSDGTTKAHLSAERQETLDLLQRDARALERALNGIGLKTDRDTLNFSLRQDGAAGREAFGGREHGTGASGSSSDEETAIEPDIAIRGRIIDPTRIDLLI